VPVLAAGAPPLAAGAPPIAVIGAPAPLVAGEFATDRLPLLPKVGALNFPAMFDPCAATPVPTDDPTIGVCATPNAADICHWH
jgi:hypothetical protein